MMNQKLGHLAAPYKPIREQTRTLLNLWLSFEILVYIIFSIALGVYTRGTLSWAFLFFVPLSIEVYRYQ
jgi:hypothetical protein